VVGVVLCVMVGAGVCDGWWVQAHMVAGVCKCVWWFVIMCVLVGWVQVCIMAGGYKRVWCPVCARAFGGW
jgi:hypothetical protein